MENEFKTLIKEDLAQYIDKSSFTIKDYLYAFIKHIGFKYVFFLRLCKFCRSRKTLFLFFLINRVILRHLSIKYGIQISYKTDIKGGFKINHYSGIGIDQKAKIGRNLNIRQNTTIGNTYKGCPTIGDNVYIGANCVLIGKITIGNNVVIGAGSVVNKSIPDNCTVVGNPCRIIDFNNNPASIT